MRQNALTAAIANLKRHDRWRLRGDSGLPGMLLPKFFMLKEDVDAVCFGKDGATSNGITRKKFIDREKHRAAIVCFHKIDDEVKRHSANLDMATSIFQIFFGSPVHNTHLVLGKMGCVKLIRQRLSEEMERNSGKHVKLSIEELAEYISPDTVEATLKFLDRLNIGALVNESSSTLQKMCEKLLLDIGDVAFAVPTIYKNRERAPKNWSPTLWAEPWGEWIAQPTRRRVPSYNIFFKIIHDGQQETTPRQIQDALGRVYNGIRSHLKSSNRDTTSLGHAADDLHELDFDVWISYREGLRNAEPDQQPKLFLTVAKKRSIHNVVPVHGYLRFERQIDFDSLPRTRPYSR